MKTYQVHARPRLNTYRYCLLDTLRSQIECDEMSLHGHLFTVFLVSPTRHELMYAIATMSEIWGMGIYDMIVLAC